MVITKSLDELNIIIALLRDVQTLHCEAISPRALRLTIEKIIERSAREGRGFLTKSLPRLGKAFDKALLGVDPLDATSAAFEPADGRKFPKFLGELFERVLDFDGRVLPDPDVESIKSLRQVLYLFYKYELPYDQETEQSVIQKFVKTDEDVGYYSNTFSQLAKRIDCNPTGYTTFPVEIPYWVVRRARRLLSELFSGFDLRNIIPRHGPGAVSTKEQLFGKYSWSKISPRIIQTYPLDEYYFSSLGHVCDRFDEIQLLELTESYAKVCLVPKDSRGPRLISEESLDFQWIQQGLGRAIVEHVESHPLTRYNIHFTDQTPNQFGALLGSQSGLYSTLDLNEASDRISVGLVRLLFPEPLLSALMNCRSLGTQLPNGELRLLNKYAPMGSCLCFPVLALTIWALLTAATVDANARESILVYGDDVVVTTAEAENAIKTLETFGLKINRDKSCTTGFFRESCGVDAYKGINVTPVRFRTVWRSRLSPDVYSSWIAYANSMWDIRAYNTYELITDRLFAVYGKIPSDDMNLSCPSLRYVPEQYRPTCRRVNRALQKLEYLVWDSRPVSIKKEIDGWSMLLRYFVEFSTTGGPWDMLNGISRRSADCKFMAHDIIEPVLISVSSYTKRRANKLVRAWR